MKNRVVACLLMLGLSGCAEIYTARGVYHRMRPGETLYGLAKKYRVPLQEVAEINNIEDPTDVKVGRSIYIPGIRLDGEPPPWMPREKGTKARPAWGVRKKEPSRPTEEGVPGEDRIEVFHGRFAWPLPGAVTSSYGVRNGRRHDGIDIRAERGASVRAAADGEVVLSRRMRGYGNLILVKHAGNFFTVYAHNAVNLVTNGVKIRRGEVISKVGSTGRATAPHLHFEVREGAKARNPLFFLPRRG